MFRLPNPSNTVALTQDTAAPPPLPAAKRSPALESSQPACFSSIQPSEPLDGALVGECFRQIRERREAGRDVSDLAEHLYRCIAEAPHIRMVVDELSWPALSEAQEAFRAGALNPETFGEKPTAGTRRCYDWVAERWGLLLPPRRGQPPLPANLEKPRPVHDAPALAHELPLGMRLMAREAPPGAILASTDDTNRAGQPRWCLQLRNDRTLSLVTGASHSQHAISPDVCHRAQALATRAMADSKDLGDFITRYNGALPHELGLRPSEVGEDGVVSTAGLMPAPSSGPSRRLQCSYAALGDREGPIAHLGQAPAVAQRLAAAGQAAASMEQRALRETRQGIAQAGASTPRPALLRGCATQMLMDTTATVEQRLAAASGQPPSTTLTFQTPLSRTVALLRPIERTLLLSMSADLPGVATFVREQLSQEQRLAAREQHGSVTAMVKQALDAAAKSMRAHGAHGADAAPGGIADDQVLAAAQAWPDIGRLSGLPHVAMALTDPARPAATASSPPPEEAQAPEPQYLDPARLSGSFSDSLDAAREQPLWLSTPAHQSQLLDLEDSGPRALPYLSLGGQQASPVAGPTSEAPLTARNIDQRLDDLVRDIQTPGHWTGFAAELGPRFLVDCPAWPEHRGLDIVNHKNGELLARSGTTRPGKAPVTVALNLPRSHYSPVLDGKIRKAPANGDCFYHSVLVALGQEDRQVLQRTIGVSGDSSVGDTTQALREHLAWHLDNNREDYRDAIIELHGQLGG